MRYAPLLVLLLIMSCHYDPKAHETPSTWITQNIIDPEGTTLSLRFNTPDGYTRISSDDDSFSKYLRSLPLKDHNASVEYYNGSIKSNQSVYVAVVDMPIGNKDLHQCADAIMRLRAEHLWKNERYEDIHFNFTNGFRCDYTKWMAGNRMKVEGNKTEWLMSSTPSNDYDDYWAYMELIFTYAGTASLSQELNPIPINSMEIGDVLIKGGHPGHAVLVIDMAYNPKTQEKLYMLGQSYMPAQDFQILKNNNDTLISPWYRLNDEESIITPEWTFSSSQLMRF